MILHTAAILITFILTFSLSSVSRPNNVTKPRIPITNPNQKSEDTIFIRNYVCKKTAYLYAEPNLPSQTKIKIPKNVVISTIKASGDFEYGDFNNSSDKRVSGWFLKADLQSISLTAPKTDK